jgi:integrase
MRQVPLAEVAGEATEAKDAGEVETGQKEATLGGIIMARKRRGREEGSIYQRADGLWVASVSLGYDANGKRNRRVAYGTTKKEAQDNLRQLQATAEGDAGDAQKQTVEQYLGRWLQVVKPTVEPATYEPYRRHCLGRRVGEKKNKRGGKGTKSAECIVKHLGPVKLAKLRRAHVEQFYADLLAAGVSPAQCRKIGTTLTIALNAAVDSKLIDYNPAAGVRKPKAAKPEMHVLDLDQVAAFLKAAAKDRLHALYVTALDTGMRPGEIFALEWHDTDLEGGHLMVRRSLEEIDGKVRVKEVKTPKARRRIQLAPQTVAALHEHRKQMLAEGHLGGPVFCDTRGGYLRNANLRQNSFKPILKRAGLPSIRLYDLRHTCATLLLLADEPAKVVSERLGHSTITLTLDTYSHVLPTMQQRAAEKMGRILGYQPAETGVGG